MRAAVYQNGMAIIQDYVNPDGFVTAVAGDAIANLKQIASYISNHRYQFS
jgi:hypothetical protein